MSRLLCVAAALLAAPSIGLAGLPFDHCFEQAASRFGVDKRLLVAIAKTESSFNPNAIGKRNANGTYDVGIMQINSSWLPALKKYGIGQAELISACTNIQVGAWILAQNVGVHGQTWKAVGAYNAASTEKQVTYASKVARNYAALGPLFGGS